VLLIVKLKEMLAMKASPNIKIHLVLKAF